ncbi:MAG TPA: coproporphyrinogen III oxidase, partial [Limnochordia bacterium]|nr:coproporphyrinogen III oxidase [Limnochordia bacterium]
EISNFARPGRPCRHNLVYWQYGEYLGLGPGAHSFWDGVRWSNQKLPQAYRQRLVQGEAPVDQTEAIPPEERLDEAMMLGLRLNAGISVPAFQSRFDRDPRAVYGRVLQPFVDAGRLELNAAAIRLTPAGRATANAVFAAVLRSGDS